MAGSDKTIAKATKSSGSHDGRTTDAAVKDASGLLQTLQGHIDEIRSMLQCGICVRPLYEPYTLACGHTFCYGCLTSWFTANSRSKKTCPDCRAQVKTQPAPAYLVRGIVHMFTNHAELLEKGETTAQHKKLQKEEQEKVEADKANTHPQTGGLFQGCFKERPSQPIIDVEDGVTRCPNCAWELEDDACVNCGYHVDADETVTGTTDSEENSEMTDYNEDMEDGFGDMDEDDWNEVYDGVPFEQLPFGVQQFYDPLRRMHQRYHNLLQRDPYEWQFPHSGSSVTHDDSEDEEDEEDEEEEEDEDEDEDEEMDSFIDDDEELEDEESGTDHSTVVGDHSYMTHDEYETSTDASASQHGGEHDSDSEEDEESVEDENEGEEEEEDEAPIRRPGPQRRFHGPYGRAVGSGPRTNHRNQRNNRGNGPERSSRPVQTTSRSGTSANNAIPVDDDSDGPVPATRRARNRRNQGRQSRS
ncbi:hypothetical protein VTN77DRAFT_5327 [Rasamsonia byssochlamydoides]|uniref:uncharacterized protein n=1 Tax=Rasamsonia byssochlamydoides TaxID=89139 RepID=UPI003742DDCA